MSEDVNADINAILERLLKHNDGDIGRAFLVTVELWKATKSAKKRRAMRAIIGQVMREVRVDRGAARVL